MRLSSPARFAPLVFLLAFAGNAGCENKHIGRPCELNVKDDGGDRGAGATSTINDQALECPTRICILPPGEKTTDTGPYCTSDCSSDDDCADGETRGSSGTDKRCKTGYACAVATTVGDFCCRRMCICHDFVETPVGGFQTPAVCRPGQTSCKNVK